VRIPATDSWWFCIYPLPAELLPLSTQAKVFEEGEASTPCSGQHPRELGDEIFNSFQFVIHSVSSQWSISWWSLWEKTSLLCCCNYLGHNDCETLKLMLLITDCKILLAIDLKSPMEENLEELTTSWKILNISENWSLWKGAEKINVDNLWVRNKNGEDTGDTTFIHSHPCPFNVLCQNFADGKSVKSPVSL